MRERPIERQAWYGQERPRYLHTEPQNSLRSNLRLSRMTSFQPVELDENALLDLQFCQPILKAAFQPVLREAIQDFDVALDRQTWEQLVRSRVGRRLHPTAGLGDGVGIIGDIVEIGIVKGQPNVGSELIQVGSRQLETGGGG